MKEMNHENVNRFFGLSIEHDSTILCLWSYCAKRSLIDFIFNDEIHLDLPFQVSILRDIISVKLTKRPPFFAKASKNVFT